MLLCRSALAPPASGEARFIDYEWIDTARNRVVPARHYWPAHGTASLHIQHVGSDETRWQGNPLMLLDRLLQRDSPFHAAIDRRRIVAAGHSFGANTTLILTGAQVIRDGKPLGFRSPQFTASIVISAPPFYGETDLAAVLASVDVPTLHVITTEDTIRIPGRYSPVQDRIDV